MGKFPDLYPYSAAEAERLQELEQWRQSRMVNIRCKEAIERAVSRDFDGMRLKDGCVQSVLTEFGYKRVIFVLANTLKEKEYDGRFSATNRAWFGKTFVPPDGDHNASSFVVDSHPAVLDGFMTEFRKLYQGLGLFGSEQCEPDPDEAVFEGKVLAVSPAALDEDYFTPQDQLWYAKGGSGCFPDRIGRAVFATCLATGERDRWSRADFIGPVKEELLPDWAKAQAAKLRAGEQIEPIEIPTTAHAKGPVPGMEQTM